MLTRNTRTIRRPPSPRIAKTKIPIRKPNTIDRSKPYLRQASDYGMSTLSVHGQLVDSGHDAQSAPIRFISIKEFEEQEIKNVSAYGKDTIVYGRDAAQHDSPGQGLPSALQKLEFVKMACIPKFKNSREVRRIREHLNAENDTGYLRDFLAEHFTSIFCDIRAYYKRQYPINDPEDNAKYADYIDSLPIELQLPVPVTMGDDGRADLRFAALQAGAAEVELREEPLCALTAYMPELSRNKCVHKNQDVMLVDVGGMRVDTASAELLEAPEFGDLELRMKRKGQCHGNTAGSCYLNAQIIDSLLQRNDLQDCLEYLGVDEYYVTQRLSDKFDLLKRDISQSGVRDFVFTVYAEGRNRSWPFQFTRDTVLQIYDKWMEKVEVPIREHLGTRTPDEIDQYAGVVLVGNGARSSMLREHLKAFFKPYGLRVLEFPIGEPPCSRGALTQHLIRDVLPPTCFFYISRTEDFYKTLHPDAELYKHLQHALELDATRKVVHHRLLEIKCYSAVRGFEPKGTRRSLIEVPVKMHDNSKEQQRTSLDIPLYWSETMHPPHAPVCTPQGQQVNGLRKLIAMFYLPHAEEFESEGFKQYSSPALGRYSLAPVFIDMQGDASGLVLNATVMKPRFKGIQFRHDLVWQTLESQTVWSPTSSHFVSQDTGTATV
jgi:hypothetical protein